MTEKPYSAANTSVVLLAAGHGKRMWPLTKTTPKPLLKIGDASLIEHHLKRISDLGFRQIVINTAYLGEMIHNHLGDGSQFNLSISYSDESNTGALETAGGLIQALPLIHSDPFVVINADIWTDFDFTHLLEPLDISARLVLVDNPPHNPAGDFCLTSSGLLSKLGDQSAVAKTFSGIALYKKSAFNCLSSGKRPLLPVFNSLIEQRQLSGIYYSGTWSDIGTPERLESIRQN